MWLKTLNRKGKLVMKKENLVVLTLKVGNVKKISEKLHIISGMMTKKIGEGNTNADFATLWLDIKCTGGSIEDLVSIGLQKKDKFVVEGFLDVNHYTSKNGELVVKPVVVAQRLRPFVDDKEYNNTSRKPTKQTTTRNGEAF